MNILHLSTYPHGGAATSCKRISFALRECGVNSEILTSAESKFNWPFYWERLSFLPFERDKSVRFSFSLANVGHDLSKHPKVQKSDILHLHWINQGFLSLKNIQALSRLGKPLVWSLHDMWPFSGGCHYSGACQNYRQQCGNCPYLRKPAPTDLSNRIWERKRTRLPKNIQFIAHSDWLAEEARTSSLLSDYPVLSIPTPIDTNQFHPVAESVRQQFRRSQNISEDAVLLLFVAVKVQEERKGFKYLLDALNRLKMSQSGHQLEVLVIGNPGQGNDLALPYPTHVLGVIRDPEQLALIYSVADIFAIPSLEDNLPNTVLEALASGTPVVGFETGGIPQMVGHLKQGFIAPQRDSIQFADGISWIAKMQAEQHQHLRLAAREKAEQYFSNQVVGKMLLQEYNRLL